MKRRILSDLWRAEDGSATVEFVIIFPLIFAMFLTSTDFSIMMLRQIYLDRALDIAVREVRLGNVPANGFDGFREAICQNTILTPTCVETITVEMRPISAAEFATLDPNVQCVNRKEEFHPMLDFNPGGGGQELMLIRTCTVSNPFIVLNGWIFGAPRGPDDDFMSVSVAVFVNEPV